MKPSRKGILFMHSAAKLAYILRNQVWIFELCLRCNNVRFVLVFVPTEFVTMEARRKERRRCPLSQSLTYSHDIVRQKE